MNENMCNNCGASYAYRNGRWICPYCGSYRPEEMSNEELTLLYTAYRKLRQAEFGDAEKDFDDMIQKYPENSEGYWGRLMARYGIKYEPDFDGRMVPTCYAASIESVTAAFDFQKALKYADGEHRAYYEQQAAYIERVRREWIEKASREKPYDVFICYKESDAENGVERTADSFAAQNIYTYLTDLGYHVFYSHVSLKGKVGEKYEPYIFNAISTAKVMLVYGSSPEYITSTWMKNEWSRYEKKIRSGEKKQGSLLVACDGFSPNELPQALSLVQCFYANEGTFYVDLDKAIRHIVCGENDGGTAASAQSHGGGNGGNGGKKRILGPAILLSLLVGVGILFWFLFGRGSSCDHVTVVAPAIPATCTQDGLTEGRYCSVCGEILSAQTVIPAKHTPGPSADCTQGQFCSVCGDELQTALGHEPGAAPTCTEGQNCVRCQEELAPAKGHEASKGSCTEARFCAVCGVDLGEAVHLPGAWTVVIPSTKTEDGLRECACTVCGEKLSEVIPALGSSGLSYWVNADGKTCTVKGMGDCTDTEVIVPAVIDGYAVTHIDAYAFSNCWGLKSLVLKNGVKRLEANAIVYCPDLTSVVIPASVEWLGGNPFFNCPNLSEISVDEKNPWYQSVDGVLFDEEQTVLFCYPAGKTEPTYAIPDGVERIVDSAFFGCNGLTRVTVPESVVNFGESPFDECNSLTEITVDSNNRWYRSADGVLFDKEQTLLIRYPAGKADAAYTVPKDVKEIARWAFNGCRSLASIWADENNGAYSSIDGVLFNKEKTTLLCYPVGREDATYVIPSGVTAVGELAFYACENLTCVTIPQGVTLIEDYAFENCTGLVRAVISDTVTKIGNRAFFGCDALTEVTVGSGIRYIGSEAFWCLELEELNYGGTEVQWSEVVLGDEWNFVIYVIYCTDGAVYP